MIKGEVCIVICFLPQILPKTNCNEKESKPLYFIMAFFMALFMALFF